MKRIGPPIHINTPHVIVVAAAAAQTSATQPGGVPAAPEDGGPRNWEVTGVARALNLRQQPSTMARIVAGYSRGAILDASMGRRRRGRGAPGQNSTRIAGQL